MNWPGEYWCRVGTLHGHLRHTITSRWTRSELKLCTDITSFVLKVNDSKCCKWLISLIFFILTIYKTNINFFWECYVFTIYNFGIFKTQKHCLYSTFITLNNYQILVKSLFFYSDLLILEEWKRKVIRNIYRYHFW